MEELIQLLNDLIQRLNAPEHESVEWYLLNNLLRFKEVAESSSAVQDLEKQTHILTRFCIESMNWDTPLFKEVTIITEQAKRVISNGLG